MSLEEDQERYAAALHGVQTATAFAMSQGTRHAATEPKHMRVGIDSAHVSIAALATLLIEKGVFTIEEYTKANADAMEKELAQREAEAPPGIHFV
jgi:hypothetical protein